MSKEKAGAPRIEVCMGSACADNKAKKLYKRLEELLEARGIQDTVKLKKCDCLGYCKQAPVVAATPGQVIHEKVKPRHAEALLDAVLAGAATFERLPAP